MLRRTLVLAFLLIPATAQATAPMNPGGWGELTGGGTCFTSTPDNSGCGQAKALVGLASVAVTPDGTQVLVAGGTNEFTFYGHGEGFGGLSVFSRDAATGALAPQSCFSSDGGDGGGGDGCAPATALSAANAVAVSPDGAWVAVASTGSGSVTVFGRDAATGKLTEMGCLQQNVPLGGSCRAAPVLDGVSTLAFTPDGRDLIALSPPRSALVDIRHDDTGALAMRCYSATGTSGSCTRMPRLRGLDAVAMAPDGKEVYLRANVGVAWLARDAATGTLTPSGCIDPIHGDGSCTAVPENYYVGYAYGSYASGGHTLVLSPDGHSLYTQLGDQLSAFTRDDDGTLHAGGCYVPTPQPSDDTSGDQTTGDGTDTTDTTAGAAQASSCTQIDAFNGARTLAITPDGSTVFTLGYINASIFHRDASGALTDAGCLAENDSRCGQAPIVEALVDVAASPDGKQVYGAGASSVATFAPAPALARAARGTAVVRCAVACRGTLRAVTYGSGLRAGAVARGAARAFALAAGGRARIRVPVAAHRGRIVLVATPRAGSGLARASLGFGRRGLVTRGRYCLRAGCSFLGGTIVAPQRRAGRFAAFAVRSRVRRGVWHTAVAVVDMAHRRIALLAPAQDDGIGVAVTRLVAKADGAVAWIACRGNGTRCTREHADSVWIHDVFGKRLLSSAPGRIGDVLTLNGSTLGYEVAGARLRMALR